MTTGSTRTTKIRAALALGVIGLGGCDATRIDHRTCYESKDHCLRGYTCNVNFQCVPSVDGGIDAGADMARPDVPIAIDSSSYDSLSSYDAADVSMTIDGSDEAGAVLDTATIDVGIDARAIDAAGTCGDDSDCVSPDARFCVQGLCVACKTAAECTGGSPICSSAHTCVSCAAVDAGCPGPTPVCEASSGRCFECLGDTDCAGKPTQSFCVERACVACSAPGAKMCGARDPSKPICLADGRCGECASSADCATIDKPICNTSASVCTGCTSDSQCQAKGSGSGVCVADGHCATSVETVYVGRTAVGACSDTVVNAGSLQLPFCSADKAVAAGKRVIIVLNDLADSFPLGSLVSPLTIVGRNGVITARMDTDGIAVIAGDLTLRGLTITGNPSSSKGIGVNVPASPQRAATIHIDDCTISKHANGGIFLSSAGFDIRNTTVTKNGSGPASDGTVWSGIRVDKLATSGSMSLNLVTVSDNAAAGLSCVAAVQGQGVLATGNSPNLTPSCGLSSCAAVSTSCGSQL